MALAEIQAEGRTFPALSQVQMQSALRAALQRVTGDELPGHGGAPHGLQTVAGIHSNQGTMKSVYYTSTKVALTDCHLSRSVPKFFKPIYMECHNKSHASRSVMHRAALSIEHMQRDGGHCRLLLI